MDYSIRIWKSMGCWKWAVYCGGYAIGSPMSCSSFAEAKTASDAALIKAQAEVI